MVRKQQLLFVSCAALLWFSLFPYVSILTPFVEGLGASHSQAGLVIGSFGFVQVFLRIPSGFLSDKMRTRTLFVQLSFCFSLLSAVAFYFSKDVPMAFIARSIAGIAATTWVHYNVHFSSVLPDSQTTTGAGVLNAIAMIAQTLAMLAGGIVSELVSMEAVFLLGAATAAMGLFISLFLVEKQQPKIAHSWQGYLEVFRHRSLWKISALTILIQFLTYAVTFGFIPLYAKFRFGSMGTELGLLSVAATVAGAISSMFGNSRLVRRLGELRTVQLGLVVFAVASAATPWASSLAVLGLLQVVSGLGRGVSFAVAMSIALKVTPADRRATAMGLYQALYGIGMVAGPLVMGVLSDFVGLGFSFILVGVGVALTTLLLGGFTSKD